ncbi:MAG TPA: hypothetical protein P5533_01785 [Candidatus Cloacimonadota bacterium]|nr:hypothetical protein [Candidatus Cloacimonadota bacterium]
MKKALLICSLIMLVSLIFGQKSLYDIAFDAPLAETEAMLKSKGFMEINRVGGDITYNSDTIPNLLLLQIRMNDDKNAVQGWELRYDLSQDSDVEPYVIDMLKEIHGEYQVYNDYDYDYIWYFPNDKALYVSVYSSGRLVLYYTNGNWDDDDYYYYEDYGW